jgi:hypothetical protein
MATHLPQGTGSNTQNQSDSRPARSWFMVLFGIPFAAAGIGLFVFLVLPTLSDWQKTQSWVPVQAELLQAELRSHQGDDSTTWEATARYRYDYAANTWENDRVALSGGSDNIGSFQEDLGNFLENALASGVPVTVYVNPQNPREAIINRELRIGLMVMMSAFSLVFALVGLGVMAAGFFAKTQTPADSASRLPGAPPPWQTRPEWSSPRIESSSTMGLRGVWFFAIIWCALTLPANLVIPEEIAKGNWPVLVILLFDIVGISLLVQAVRQTLSAKKFGSVPLTLDPFPGAAGGDVGGYIDIPVAHDPGLSFRVSLSCTRRHVSGSGKNRSTHHEAKWQDEKWLNAEPLGDGQVRLWFRFEPPAGLPVSEAPGDDYHYWQLHLSAGLPGLDLERQYELPVFQTGARSSSAVPQRVQVSMTQDLAAIEALTNFAQVPGGAAMTFRAGRSWRGALVAIAIVGGIFGGVGVAVLRSDADVITQFFLGGIFSLIGLVGVASGVWMLGNSLYVEATDTGVQIRRWLFGIPVKQLQCTRSEVVGVGIARGGSSTVGTRTTVHYDLLLKTADGKTHGVGNGFRGATQATLAAESFTRYTRLPFLGELDRSELFAVRKAAYLASRRRDRAP